MHNRRIFENLKFPCAVNCPCFGKFVVSGHLNVVFACQAIQFQRRKSVKIFVLKKLLFKEKTYQSLKKNSKYLWSHVTHLYYLNVNVNLHLSHTHHICDFLLSKKNTSFSFILLTDTALHFPRFIYKMSIVPLQFLSMQKTTDFYLFLQWVVGTDLL